MQTLILWSSLKSIPLGVQAPPCRSQNHCHPLSLSPGKEWNETAPLWVQKAAEEFLLWLQGEKKKVGVYVFPQTF